MSSSDFRGLINDDNDPLARIVRLFQNKFSKFTTDASVEAVDSDSEDIEQVGVTMESVIKIHSLNGQHKFNFTTVYIHPLEPDENYVHVMLRGRGGTGNSIADLSGFNNNGSIFGDTLLVDGTLDIGCNNTGTKSVATRFNRPSSDFENEEYIKLPDNTHTKISNITTGFSEWMRVRPFAIDNQGDISRTLWEKVDDNTPNDARMLQIRDTGRLLYVVKDGGVTTAKWTPTGTIEEATSTSLPYDIVCTYATSGNVIHIYVNGVDQTLSTSSASINWQDTLTNHDLYLMERGAGSEDGHVYGDFYGYRLYREKVLSQTEVTRFYTNKWSISNIAFGAVAIEDHYATWIGSGGAASGGFDATGFDNTGFDTTP